MSGIHTEKRIMNATVEILLLKGYDAMRTREIAERSGVSEATIFKYFRSKEDLLKALVIDLVGKFTDESKVIIGNTLKEFTLVGNGSYKDLLRKIIIERTNYFLTQNKLIRLLIREMLINFVLKKLFIETIYNNLIGVLEVIIRKGIERGEFNKTISPEILKDTIFGLIIYNTVLQNEIDNKSPVNVNKMTDFIINSIK